MAIEEAISSVAAPHVCSAVIQDAVKRSGMPQVPAGGPDLLLFAEGALREALDSHLGEDLCLEVMDQLQPTLRFAASAPMSIPPAPAGKGSIPSGSVPSGRASVSPKKKPEGSDFERPTRPSLTPPSVRDLGDSFDLENETGGSSPNPTLPAPPTTDLLMRTMDSTPSGSATNLGLSPAELSADAQGPNAGESPWFGEEETRVGARRPATRDQRDDDDVIIEIDDSESDPLLRATLDFASDEFAENAERDAASSENGAMVRDSWFSKASTPSSAEPAPLPHTAPPRDQEKAAYDTSFDDFFADVNDPSPALVPSTLGPGAMSSEGATATNDGVLFESISPKERPSRRPSRSSKLAPPNNTDTDLGSWLPVLLVYSKDPAFRIDIMEASSGRLIVETVKDIAELVSATNNHDIDSPAILFDARAVEDLGPLVGMSVRFPPGTCVAIVGDDRHLDVLQAAPRATTVWALFQSSLSTDELIEKCLNLIG